MQDIIKRLEAASRRDESIDEAIMATLCERKMFNFGASEEQDDGSWAPVEQMAWVDRETGYASTHAREFTGSLDAAIRLKPADYWWECVQKCAPDSPMRSFGHGKMFVAKVGKFGSGSDYHVGAHDDPIIALCIAALKAKSAAHVGRHER